MSELDLSPGGVGRRLRDNAIRYSASPDAREGLELIKAFTRVRDAQKRSEILQIVLEAADR